MSSKVIRQCQRCGNTFEVFAAWVRKGGGKFCSRTCRTLVSARKCDMCGTEFTPEKHTGRFCSAGCGSKSRRGKATRKAIDLTGQRFVRLTVVERHGHVGKDIAWKVTCDCGSQIIATTHALRTGNTKSCGCLRNDTVRALRKTHGLTKTPTYTSWRAMMQRCAEGGSYYGRFTVDERWHIFENFLADMGERPRGRYSIDRIDNSRGYFRGNCRWADYYVQARNKIQYNAAKTHCIHGHELTGKNLYVHRGKRACLACRRVSKQRRRAIRAAAAG